MDTIQSIRKLGFRQWYQRTLLRSHGNLVLLILSAFALLLSAEAYSRDLAASAQLTLLACAAASALIGAWALRGYFRLMHAAQVAVEQATCAQCEAYGRWTITHEDPSRQQMQVRCRQCDHEWTIALLALDDTAGPGHDGGGGDASHDGGADQRR